MKRTIAMPATPAWARAAEDATKLATALFVPAACYVWIAIYGILIARVPGLNAIPKLGNKSPG